MIEGSKTHEVSVSEAGGERGGAISRQAERKITQTKLVFSSHVR